MAFVVSLSCPDGGRLDFLFNLLALTLIIIAQYFGQIEQSPVDTEDCSICQFTLPDDRKHNLDH